MSILHNLYIERHPCFSNSRENLWHRIHLPVAPKCNVKCVFCSHSIGSSCHTSKPGFSSQLMTPEVAASRAMLEINLDPRIRIVAVSGPGEPLANSETFETFELIREQASDIHFCLSTNGTLLSERVSWLRMMDFKTVTVSMSTARASTAARFYEWAVLSEERMTGERMGQIIIDSQLRGISDATNAGLTVKVNTILIPGLNQEDIIELAKSVSDAGAAIQNIVPLVPNARLASLMPPSKETIEEARKKASRHIEQFRHCKQCRSDVVGLPGCDVIL